MFTESGQFFTSSGGYEISQSIRFNDDDSAHMARDGFGQSPTSSTDCTISVWVKRGNNLGSNSTIFYGGDPNGSTAESLRFGTGNQLQFSQASVDYDLKTTQVFRDVEAWYHIVAVLNTDAAESSRAALYVNGSQVSDFATENYPGSSYSTNFTANSSSVEHVIGSNAAAGNASQFFDGYIAEFNFIDGQVLTPASFGETNDDGVWIPKKYSGAYGNNGFFIDGRDSSDLGDDESGNGNDLAGSGLAAADQMSDSPTNNHCTLNPLWVDGHTLSDGNLVASAAADSAAIGTMAFDPTDSAGFYFEAKITTAATYPNVGIRTVESPSQVGAVTSLSGNSTGRYAFTGSNGQFNDAGSGSSYGSAWAGTADKVIGVLVKAGALYFSIDGTIQNSGTAAKTGLTGLMLPTVFYDAGSGTTAAWEMRFDASDWSTTPSGYKAITTSGLGTPTITDGTKYFHTQLYTGNGSSGLAVTNDANAGDFKPDLWYLAPRSNGDNHVFIDVARGQTQRLKTNSNAAEDTDSPAQITFETDGFDLDTTDVNFNGSGRTYVAWQWETQGGAGSSNEDGSINTTTTSVNQTAGISLSTYTGTGANATVGHGLGTAPSFVIIKSRNDTHDWYVRTPALSGTEFILLNSNAVKGTASPEVWNSTAPTSSVVNIGTSIGVNRSSYNYVMYCFAEIPGYSAVGSYVGNGAADGPYVSCGFKPAWVMGKRIAGSGGHFDWWLFDSKRPGFNVTNARIHPNNNSAEDTGAGSLDLLSSGFKIRTDTSSMNNSGDRIIYIAFAEHPFANPDGAPATAR